jgi:hypothetical protein
MRLKIKLFIIYVYQDDLHIFLLQLKIILLFVKNKEFFTKFNLFTNIFFFLIKFSLHAWKGIQG